MDKPKQTSENQSKCGFSGRIFAHLAPYGHILYLVLLFIAFYALIRLVGIVIYRDSLDIAEIPRMMLNGLRCDLSGLGYIMALPVLLTFTCSIVPLRVASLLLLLERIWLWLILCLVVFLEFSTFPFMAEYSVRPNRLFVEYLAYPEELINLMIHGHLLAVIAVCTLMICAGYLLYHLVRRIKINPAPSLPGALLTFVLVGAVTFIAARSSFDHRPFNLAKASFSSNQIVNNLAGNSGYTLITSLKASFAEKANNYADMKPQEVLQLVKQDTGFDYTPASADNPTLNQLRASYPGQRRNIVIILEESLGAQFVGTLGGSNLTPQLDRIYSQGWGFAQMYATGVRSVRGIEAVTSGFTPSVNTATVKREKSQKNFFNLGGILKSLGYHTAFIYGGESHFDNMRSFFLGNGYEQIIDIDDYPNPRFLASWGVSDEELFDKALSYFDENFHKGQPFYALVFTSSNHDPYEIPPEFAQGAPQSRENAVRYADFALGRLYDKLKERPYFNDTVFLVIADHDARSGGNALVPVNNFHIPAVIFGAGIAQRLDDRVVSQIDMPKTLLSLAGISAAVPTVGYDLTQSPSAFSGRALLQFYQNFALLQGDGSLMMVLPDGKFASCHYDFKEGRIEPAADNEQLQKLALAYAHLGEYAYDLGYFHNCPLPKP